jgi:hypothetical protein
VLLNKGLVRREVDAVDLVVADEAVNPLDLRTELAERLERLQGPFADFGIREL